MTALTLLMLAFCLFLAPGTKDAYLLHFPVAYRSISKIRTVFSYDQSSLSSVLKDETMIDKRTGKRLGWTFLPPETMERAKSGSLVEKIKLEKDGTSAFTDIYDFAAKIRSGTLSWEDIEKDDLDFRLKWVGLLHRSKRTPGSFMMRLRTPNGIVTADQMRFYADSVDKYGPEQGVLDITTRANIQLRGVKIEDAPDIIDGLHKRNQTCFQSALDNVRNLVGSPLAGIDDYQMVDTRDLCNALNDLVSLDPITGTRGNPVYGCLPRKLNIAISGSRDDYSHIHLNDIGLQPCGHHITGVMGFNVYLGGYLSIKRCTEAIAVNMWVPSDRNSVITLVEAILRVWRDEADRKDRQRARLMWLVEHYGVDNFKQKIISEVNSYDRGVLIDNAQPTPTDTFIRRELLGVHKQSEQDPSSKFRVGIHVPTGRLSVLEARQIADLADKYSEGEIRLTVEQNILLANVSESQLDDLLKEPALSQGSRLSVFPGLIEGNIVSCTGSQFCGLALIETKSNAANVAKKLEQLVEVDRPVRIHWTGCPNSCGVVQAADIGIMGAPAKKLDPVSGKMKAVSGCKIFVGGTVGEDMHLSLDPYVSGIPLDEEDLVPVLVDILKTKFGAKCKD